MIITDAMVEAAVEVYAAHDPQSTLLDGPAMLAALAAALAAAWRPISEVPQNWIDEGKRVLLLCGQDEMTGEWEEGYTHGWTDHRGHHVNPTHFMPLPEPPKEVGG